MLTLTTAAGLEFLVRFVLAGTSYGRDDALTADRDMIEFYAGQGLFIARYRVEDFGPKGSLQLDMGGSYYLDHDAADAVRAWLDGCGTPGECLPTNVTPIR